MAIEHYIYIVRCKDGTLYTGYTNNVQARIEKHNAGKGAKYTKTRRPVVLLYQEGYETKSEAMKREYENKTFTRTQKLQLIERGKQ